MVVTCSRMVTAAVDPVECRWPMNFPAVPTATNQMDPEEKEKMEKRDWLAEKIQMLNTQLEGFEADVEKAVSLDFVGRAVVALAVS